ncbi:MAG: PEGA domain-containing protein [Patescibacteria group bacterium]|nr:PEGA domain-containing protein [Patescibacteria group bacterium]
MPKKIRDLIFYLFIIIFIIASTATCLYASGYKFNLSWPLEFNRLLQKTGNLNISTSPKGAAIFLNDKKQVVPGFKLIKKDYLSTPAKIRNLMPGDYYLRIEKENYWPLEKKINIASGLTTFAEDLNLFRSDLPIIISPSSESSIYLNNDNSSLYLKQAKSWIDLNHYEVNLLKGDKNGAWINNWEIFSAGQIININTKNTLDLNSLLTTKNVLNWKYDKDNNSIYAHLESGEILKIDENLNSSSEIFTLPNIQDFKQDQKILFTIEKEGEKQYFKEYDLETKKEIKRMELPSVGRYLFFANYKNDYISLYDQENGSLYIIYKNDWQKSFILTQVKDWSFINKNHLIYHNGWEIIFFNLENNSSNLISRVSDPIKKIIWHEKEDYFIFSTQNSIQAGDLKTNIFTTLFKTENIGDLALDTKNNILYFYAQIGQQAGIYKLLLK